MLGADYLNHCILLKMFCLLFLAALSLHYCVWTFCSWDEQGLLSSCAGFSCCSAWAQLTCGMWDLPIPGMEPMPPALAGIFLSPGPPGES